ncbi:MAG TPA: PLP-dependent aminotransferase family protein [Steroidobacteraceae bacterium]|nr:PLP-dependent aminotransferase family protein [Steroidobacteraceae bacterium]
MLRPWPCKILVRRRSQTPVYLQIVHALIDEIRRGRLSSGTALPGTRELAESLQVNRKTVVQAYAELQAQGWVQSELTRGTFVSATLPVVTSHARAPARMPATPDFPLAPGAPAIPVLLPQPHVLSFDDGAPDTRLVPVNTLARAYRHALNALSRKNALSYADPRGSAQLRAAISAMLNLDRGLSTTPENICLTRGSQMAIYLTARLLVRRGDTVVMEQLSYPPARESFRAAGAEIAAVELDAHGLRVDELERLCRRRQVRAVYLTPHHQFPTTVLLPPDRRLRLFALAAQFGFAIVEDDYDHEFHFSHRPMLPLASADPEGRVIYIGSLSKLLSPSLRLGYLAAPTAVIERATAELLLIDRQGDPAMEVAIAELIAIGEVHRHTRRVLKVYAERRELIARLLRDELADHLQFDLPDGGLAVWARFTPPVDVLRLVEAARRERLQLLPGSGFSVSGRDVQGVRLGFASLDEDELRRAVARLRAALRKLPRGG